MVTSRPRRTYATPKKVLDFIAIGREAGLDVAGFEVSPDGTIRVMENRGSPAPSNDFDRFKDQL